jgi:hypothetical protein
MNLCTFIEVFPKQVLNDSTTQQLPLGTLAFTKDGRGFRYCRAGAAALVAGNCIQAPAQIANHLAMTPTAAAIGATQITMTPGATGAAISFYNEGWMIVSTTPALGDTRGIAVSPAITASVAFTITLYTEDQLQTALTSSSRLDLQCNAYRDVIQCPITTATSACVGVAPYAIGTTNYGWLQVFGPCGVLITGTPAVGQAVSPIGAVAGAAAINSTTLGIIGTMMTTGVDTKCNAVFLDIH